MINFAISDKRWRLEGDSQDENDRKVAISWLKSLTPVTPADQLAIDKAVVALGGTPDAFFPGYEWMQQ